jgi:hypothetical protein
MDNDDQYNMFAAAAQRYAQMLQEKKAAEDAQKAAAKKEESTPSGRKLYVSATFKAERADRIAAVWFPLLREVFPESFNEEGKRKDFFKRMFKKIDAYMSREWVRNLYRALKNSNWGYLTAEENVELLPKEKDILSRSDTKRHRFMEIIFDTTNITDTSA